MKKLIRDCSFSQRIAYRLFLFLNLKKEYDDFGLRYSTPVLAAVKQWMYKMPLEMLATFADGICVEMVKRDEDSLQEMVADIDFIHYDMVNATGLGNIAYVAMHYCDKDTRQQAFEKLQDCFDRHNKKMDYEKRLVAQYKNE